MSLPYSSAPQTFCTQCDAAEGECSHDAHRYLEPITRVALEPKEGIPQAWKATGPDEAKP